MIKLSILSPIELYYLINLTNSNNYLHSISRTFITKIVQELHSLSRNSYSSEDVLNLIKMVSNKEIDDYKNRTGFMDLESGLIYIEEEIGRNIGCIFSYPSGYYVVYDKHHLLFYRRNSEGIDRKVMEVKDNYDKLNRL